MLDFKITAIMLYARRLYAMMLGYVHAYILQNMPCAAFGQPWTDYNHHQQLLQADFVDKLLPSQNAKFQLTALTNCCYHITRNAEF